MRAVSRYGVFVKEKYGNERQARIMPVLYISLFCYSSRIHRPARWAADRQAKGGFL